MNDPKSWKRSPFFFPVFWPRPLFLYPLWSHSLNLPLRTSMTKNKEIMNVYSLLFQGLKKWHSIGMSDFKFFLFYIKRGLEKNIEVCGVLWEKKKKCFVPSSTCQDRARKTMSFWVLSTSLSETKIEFLGWLNEMFIILK